MMLIRCLERLKNVKTKNKKQIQKTTKKKITANAPLIIKIMNQKNLIDGDDFVEIGFGQNPGLNRNNKKIIV
jgi:hypothetical protein